MYIIPKIFKKLRFAACKNSSFEHDTAFCSGSTILNSSFGCHTYCGYDCKIYYAKIGRFTSIGDNVCIGLQNHRMDLISTSPCFISHKDSVRFKISNKELDEPQQTIIGNDVWIGDRAIIKAGIELGDGCIVGMGSVVTKNVPPYSIVAGNPAKIIRYRFDRETINKLLEYKWWDLSDKELKALQGFNANQEEFILWAESNKK